MGAIAKQCPVDGLNTFPKLPDMLMLKDFRLSSTLSVVSKVTHATAR